MAAIKPTATIFEKIGFPISFATLVKGTSKISLSGKIFSFSPKMTVFFPILLFK
jgi:hypothetical protein